MEYQEVKGEDEHPDDKYFRESMEALPSEVREVFMAIILGAKRTVIEEKVQVLDKLLEKKEK